MKTYKNIRKIANVQGNDYSILWLLDYSYSKDYYKMIAIDLSKQQAIAADPKATPQINFTWSLNQRAGVTMFLIIEQAKETVLDFSQGIEKVL